MVALKLLIILANFYLCIAEDELIAVTALIRHGSRIPESFYPNDPYSNISWPFVLGDLTDKGVDEMYHVGKWLKRKYNSFLSEKYDPNEIYAQSLDYDRCIMTGEATLAGLYPPLADDTWNSKLRWQPTPIHVSPINQDIVVNMNACPKIMKESEVIRQTETYKKIMAAFKDYFEYISENCGEKTDFATIYPLFDTLFSEIKVDLPLPDWAQKIWEQMVPLVELYTKMDSLTLTERRIQVGPLLTRIQSQFDRAITGVDFGTTKTTYRKFMAYFATEWILYDLTYTLGLPDINIPEFGALYLIELRRKPNGVDYVRILYRSSAKKGTRAVRVAIRKEKNRVYYGRFRKIIAPYLIDSAQWVKLCESFTGQNVSVATDVPMSK
ncbi:testicular acid phosphatase homolog [Harmonia axyridis]|uniref:testicular acid phosphatase homolog n=1 Tax=Harmonia axyridis TaxID=115357 RepID=UPI001E2780EC|nr:testicular acid phosphatase homolog [Harmonia axyridis]